MPYAIRISSQLNGLNIDSYLVEVTPQGKVITTPKLIRAMIFRSATDCTSTLNQISSISKNSYSRSIEINVSTPTDLGQHPSTLLT